MYFNINFATKKIEKSCSGTLNHFCAIARSGTDDWLAFGYNVASPHYGMRSRHAEMDALRKMSKFSKGEKRVDLYIVRITSGGSLAESKPCKYCIKMLGESNLNIRWIYYSTAEREIVRTTLYNLGMEREQYITRGQIK